MYLSVLPPLPFGAGSLSYYFFSLFCSVFEAGCYFGGYYTLVCFCCWALRFYSASRSSFCFCFLAASSLRFCSWSSACFLSAVNLSKLALQELTIVYSACFWLAKKSVLRLKKPKSVSKKPLMLPFCWMMVMRIPSNLLYSSMLKKCFKLKMSYFLNITWRIIRVFLV